MKKKKKILLSVIAAAMILFCTVAAVTLLEGHQEETIEAQETEFSPKPLVIEIPKEQIGKITIYLDGAVMHEYEGPMKVDRAAGEYKIEAWTEKCSCFSENSKE